MSEISYNESTGYYLFKCPHCPDYCEVHKTEIRCTIFRHAVYKKDLAFVNPHASKEECDKWVREGLIYGCAKPFKFDGKKVEVCGYI